MLNPNYEDFDFVYLSLGAGVQSTAMYLLSSMEQRGHPRADVAIFADTQDEPGWVYENMERLIAWAGHNNGIPIEVVTKGGLGDDLQFRLGSAEGESISSIPAFTEKGGSAGPLMRHCTKDYKVDVIERKVRELMGYKKGQHVKESVAAIIGISLDEVSRVKTSRTRWVETCYPLIDAKMHRTDCMAAIEAFGLPIPQKSSCIFCPYHSDRSWKNMKDNYPGLWERACVIDEAVRDMSRAGVDNPAFLHRSLVPLRDIQFDDQATLFDTEHGACDGFCDT